MISDREAKLIRELVETCHLGSAERAELPGGRVRWTVLVRAVGKCLAETGWFPRGWRPDQTFDGVIIEARDDDYVLHEQKEIGVARYSDVQSARTTSLEHAARTAIAANFGDDIDGVQIDWHA